MSLRSRMRRSPSGADQAHGGGPVYDAQIDHPALGALGIDYLPTLLAPDPGGLLARMGSHVLPVDPVSVPVQRSPLTHWFRGFPYPGPPATVTVAIDVDSAKWWGRTGQGMLVWSSHTEAISADLPPAIPQDMVQHVDAWHTYMGGYPSIARNRPTAFGDQVPVLNP